MQNIKIKENSELSVDDNAAIQITKMLIEEPTLPLNIRNNILYFDDYTVGSLTVGDLNIEIIPRNSSFNAETIFEMMLYESINNFDENNESSGFGNNQDFGFSAITYQFFLECSKLTDFGLTGGFVTSKQEGKEINGSIVLETFHKNYLPIRGVEFLDDSYTLNVSANQIIKSTLLKILQYEKRPRVRARYQHLLTFFSSIDRFKGDFASIDAVPNTFYSANPHYPATLEFAIKILRDMKLKFNNGEVSWYSFLHNSNDIYEKYVRKVLAKGLSAYVTKWDTPQKIAVLDDGKRKGYKSYVPDILIDYNPATNTAKAVLDAKNKNFDVKGTDISEILNSADMYQLSFYCDKLKTNLGGLIYPASHDYKPINVMIDGNQDFRFVLFGINMKERLRQRHRKLCDDIKNYLLYYIK